MSHGPLTDFLARNGRTLRKLCRAGFAISILAIVVLSLLPGDDLPDVELSDKIGHAVTGPAARSWPRRRFPCLPPPA